MSVYAGMKMMPILGIEARRATRTNSLHEFPYNSSTSVAVKKFSVAQLLFVSSLASLQPNVLLSKFIVENYALRDTRRFQYSCLANENPVPQDGRV